MKNKRRSRGFSLVELVIVIVIIGVIAAIAIPRVTQATRGANESALSSNLSILRNAIEQYAAEHNGVYPGKLAAGGTYGAAETADAFKSQLLMYSNAKGEVSETRSASYPLGPYLRKDIPPLPVGANKGSTAVNVQAVTTPLTAAVAGGEGWMYSCDTGEIIANATDDNDAGTKSFDQY